MSKDFYERLVSRNDVFKTDRTKGLMEILIIAMIIVPAINLNLSIVKKYDMADRPFIREDMIAD